MKRTLFVSLCASMSCLLASPLILAGVPRLDLGARRAVYFAGSLSGFKLTDKRVEAGGTITVKTSEGKCDTKGCTFNLGVIAFRSGSVDQLTAYGQFTGPTIGIVGNGIVFDPNATSKQHVLPVPLKIGKNTLSFTVDPENKIAENDEKNNSFIVTIILVR